MTEAHPWRAQRVPCGRKRESSPHQPPEFDPLAVGRYASPRLEEIQPLDLDYS